MKLSTTATIADYKSSPVLGNILTLQLDDDISEQIDQLVKHRIEISLSEMPKKRSKSANAYLWELLTELQNAGYGNALDLYKRYIRENGVSAARAVPKDAFKTYMTSFLDEGIGFQIERTGENTWTNENGKKVRMIEFVQYYGSHVYNREQMARLLDAVVQDCEAVGIKTKKEDFHDRSVCGNVSQR